MHVVGLTGYAGSGKSTAAQYLVERHGFTRLSFAAPLKKMLRTLNPYVAANPLPHMDSEPLRVNDLFVTMTEQQIKESPAGDEYRRLLQVLGTDCIRAVDDDFWIKAVTAVIEATDPEGKYVLDDVRFPNEAAVIKGYSPLGLWNIERAGYEAVNGHSSEQHAGNMGEKIFLLNYLDIEGLHDQIDAAVELAFQQVTEPQA